MIKYDHIDNYTIRRPAIIVRFIWRKIPDVRENEKIENAKKSPNLFTRLRIELKLDRVISRRLRYG